MCTEPCSNKYKSIVETTSNSDFYWNKVGQNLNVLIVLVLLMIDIVIRTLNECENLKFVSQAY